jgi:hypothetical protein
MKTLNERYEYGLSLFLLSIDEGITGYRDDSLEVSTIYTFIISTYASINRTISHRPSSAINSNTTCR